MPGRVSERRGNDRWAASRRTLARIALLAGDLQAVRQAVDAACNYDYPRHRARLSLLSRITQLLQDELAEASREFHAAITQADEELQHASSAYRTLDIRRWPYAVSR